MQGHLAPADLTRACSDNENAGTFPVGSAMRASMSIRLSLASLASFAVPALAFAAEQAQVAAPVGPVGSLLQMALGLAVVLACVGAIAWALQRFSLAPQAGGGAIKVVGGAAVGSRERVVLVEVAGTWLVLGVAPGQVRALTTMPKVETAAATAPAEGKSFQHWLKQIMERGDAK